MARLEAELTIAEIGARGDGIARLPDGRRVYVPGTVAGDRVHARVAETGGVLRGRVVELLGEGRGRAPPACAHFGDCGGCALQHLDAAPYRDWKTARLIGALERQGVAAGAVEPLIVAAPASRRRAEFTARRRRDDVLLGFNARASHRVVDLAECPVLDPGIFALTAPLRELLLGLLPPGATAELAANHTDSGLDLLTRSAATPGLAGRERLAAFAETHDLARVAWHHPKAGGPEIIAERRPVRMTFGGVPVALPPGAFLQATAAGEAALTQVVLDAAPEARRIADLYAGCGAFTFALASLPDRPQVHAVDGDPAAVAAVERAARAAGLPGVTTEARDLARRPLTPDELAAYDLVVFDPPRAGAKAQAAALARSRVGAVAAVSCNPASFARDVRILAEGSYALRRVRPIDQFLWSPHLEVAAVLTRGAGDRSVDSVSTRLR